MESGEEATKKWSSQCLDLCKFFIIFYFAWAKWNIIGQKVIKVGNLISYQSIIFDEERLDPHGVNNLPVPQFFQWQLSSTCGVREKVECVHCWCLKMNIPVYFCFCFSSDQRGSKKQQLKVCWWIMTYFSVILVNWIGKSKILQTNTCDRKQGTKQHKYVFAHLPASSKSRLPKQGHLEPSVCPCYRHKLWLFQSLAILYQQQTSHTCMLLWKKMENFWEKPWSCFSRKLIDLYFSRPAVSGVEWKICKDQSRLTFSSSSFATQICPHG